MISGEVNPLVDLFGYFEAAVASTSWSCPWPARVNFLVSYYRQLSSTASFDGLNIHVQFICIELIAAASIPL